MKTKFCTWPASFLLAATLSAGAATTSGPISGSEIWSNSVYLTGDVTITPTGSLTILPGTRVEADPRADDQLGGINTSRIELIVDQGVFSAVGTDFNPIVFTAGVLGANPPAKGDWYGIRVNSTNATLQNCIVEFGVEGLRVEGGTCNIDHCTFSSNKTYGVELVGSRALSLLNCIVRDSGGPGVFNNFDQNAHFTIVNSTISGNGSLAGDNSAAVIGGTVDISGTSVVNNPALALYCLGAGTVTNCYIAGNSGAGVQVGYGSSLITDSRIFNNGASGLIGNFSSGTRMTVIRCEVIGNARDGIGNSPYTSPYTSPYDVVVQDSVVANNGLVGIRAKQVEMTNNSVFGNQVGIRVDSSVVGISNNSISGNQIGIHVESSNPVVTNIISNDIFGNTTYDLENAGTAAVKADGNYWGEPTTTELSNHVSNLTKIYDSRDNASVGQVVIRNWSGTMLRSPSIVVQPQSLSVVPGLNVQFEVLAVGSPPLFYQWWKDTAIIQGATNASLVLSNVQTSAEGSYWVAVNNSLGSTNSRAAILTVEESPLTLVAPASPPATTGRLRVTILPPEAGGQWRFLWEPGWRDSGQSATNLAAGNYELEFRPVSGWVPTASSMLVAIATNATMEVTNQLFAGGDSATGWLTLTIGPDTVASNAGWHFVGEAADYWRSSGFTVSNLAAGSYLIEFKPVAGWSAPSPHQVEVMGGGGVPVTGYYLQAAPLPPGVGLPAPLTNFNYINQSLTNTPLMPFAFNGQLHSEIGYGSGVVVRKRVVLTAAHMVFNDQTLSYANSVDWFFQRHAGDYDPPPMRARGSHILTSYAAARTNDLGSGYSPGQSSPESRDSDVAALFFYAPAGRGGYGGYLFSDAGTNEWLASSRQKLLVGYPVDGASFGYVGVVPGKMHAMPATNYAFTRLTSRVYATADFLGFPGNSGGPVYVLHTNNAYYPAGVYLGRVGDLSAVRSIDSDVVDLISQAARDGDAGSDHTGGGVTYLGVPPNLGGIPIGYLSVTSVPPAVAGAATWWVEGYSAYRFYMSDLVAAIAGTTYTVHFGPVAGYIAPTTRNVTLASGVTNVLSVSYSPVNGYLKVNIEPSYAVDAGAKWYITGSNTLYQSGQIAGLAPAAYQVEGTAVAGFLLPRPQGATLTYGQTNQVSLRYTPLGVLSLGLAEGLRLAAPSGATYQIQFTPGINPPAQWSNLTTVTITNSPQRILSAFPTNAAPQFYRGVLIQ